MSRFYEGDCENPVCYMWDANLECVCQGKRGQKILREFVEALHELPERKLIANAIADPKGQVCAVGALAKKRGVDLTPYIEMGDDANQSVTVKLGEEIGLGFMLAWALGYENDCENPGLEEYEIQDSRSSGSSLIALGDGRYGYIRREIFFVELWTKSSDMTGRPTLQRVRDPIGKLVESSGHVTDEERWQALHRWASSKIKWNLPVPVAA